WAGGDLEALLEYYLDHEDERRAIADAARAKLPAYSFARLWEAALATVEERWPEVAERAAQRGRDRASLPLYARLWQALGGDATREPALAHDLAAAAVRAPH